MKELYSFNVDVESVKKTPYKKKTKNGEVEAFRKKKVKESKRIVIEKPSVSDIERAEFFFGQKYNEYINAGFLTKGMLYSKIGSLQNEKIEEEIKTAILANVEAAKVIEFYGGSENLSDEQKQKLEEAQDEFVETRMIIQNYESGVQGQYSQTAEVKAEQKILEWFIFNFSFYEDEVDGDKELFPIFAGNTFDEKRETYLLMSEDDDDSEELSEEKKIYNASFEMIARVVNIWYNKLGSNQEEIDKQLKEIFG